MELRERRRVLREQARDLESTFSVGRRTTARHVRLFLRRLTDLFLRQIADGPFARSLLTLFLHCVIGLRKECIFRAMNAETRAHPAAKRSPAAMDVYFGLLELLKRVGVREPGGSVSCQRNTGMTPDYLVAAEPYMAPRVRAALTRLLSRPVSYDETARIPLTLDEACKVAACVEAFSAKS